ncbi:uncharacterized protein EV420DRAFT_1733519 [Desarmillaria tabescens]|uniref:Uncharacterized protein n=1 Tax=Armillaria tabescens TaxID=1929756 RepID=A0AA39MNA6_ARMTA|nr:uncharacterized protein EV420DRAFT_1733519 [Desarmillaria tabescens]KAK0439715.1 hypothetical protein EV420DRAFT_1733519 [Desarmillaria tabescens]
MSSTIMNDKHSQQLSHCKTADDQAEQVSSTMPQEPNSPSDLNVSASPRSSYSMEGKIQKLGGLEARLAQEYGVADADAIRQETKARSTSVGDPRYHEYMQLYELNYLRRRMARTTAGCRIDSRILHGDIILIYFAGHGSGYPEPGHREDGPDNAIEAICPIDRGTELTDGTLIPDISDRELNAILSVISSAKGHRITVFLDCGFVGTHFRGFPPPGARSIRSLMNRASPLDMLRASDKDLAHFPGYQSVLDPDWSPDEDCFIMVVASQEYGYAKEVQFKGQDGFHGIFTYSLLRALRSEDLPE